MINAILLLIWLLLFPIAESFSAVLDLIAGREYHKKVNYTYFIIYIIVAIYLAIINIPRIEIISWYR